MSFFKKNSLLLVALFVFSLHNGCKKDNPTEPGNELVGTWVLTKLTMTTQQGSRVLTPQQADFVMTLIVRGDKTYQSTVTQNNHTEVDNGTWSVSNGKITVMHQDGKTETMTYRITGNILQFDTNTTDPNGITTQVTMELTKQ